MAPLMYYVRTTDQEKLGPVTFEVLCKWRDEGRITAATLVRAETATEWTPLGTISSPGELACDPPPILGPPAPPPLPPPLPSAPRAASAPVSALAIVSFLLGGLGFCTAGITSLPGLVAGIAGLRRIQRSEGRLQGRSLAIAGICVSALTFLILPIVLAIAVPQLTQSRARAQKNQCLDRLKMLALCLRVAASENGERLPDASRWCDAITNQLSDVSVLACPRGGRQRCGYAMNARLSGADVRQARGDTVLLFECKDGWNQAGGAEKMLTRHGEDYHVALVDGTVRKVSRAEAGRLRWQP